MQSGQAHLVDVPQLALLNQLHEEPEGKGGRTVHQQLADKEVHALHVVSLVIVAGERPQNRPEPLVAWLTNLEVLVLRKSPRQVSLNLNSGLGSRFLLLQGLILSPALLILRHDHLANV